MTTANHPLSGIRVVDLTRVLAGPLCTTVLGDFGADVIKVEPPGEGDFTRSNFPFAGSESHYFLSLNRNKRGMVVDMKKPEGLAIVRELIRTADVLVENYRPGVMERLGLSYDKVKEIKPDIIYCSISGFGQDGPLRDKSSVDMIAQAMGGLMSVNGEADGPPTKLGVPLGDVGGGVYAAMGILGAVAERARTGKGKCIDISLLDCATSLLGYLGGLYLVSGENPGRVGSRHHSVVPYGSYPSADGYVILAGMDHGFWGRLCGALDRKEWMEDERFSTRELRMKNRTILEPMIEAITRTRTTEEWMAHFDEHDITAAPVMNVGEALEQPQIKARNMVADVEHPKAGPIRLMRSPIRFRDEPLPPVHPPPGFGQHTDEVLEQVLGYDREKIAALHRDGVVDEGNARLH